jgi:hypothetical protein
MTTRTESRFKVAEAFRYGNIATGANVFTDGNTIYSYGRHFPMAIRCQDETGTRMLVNEDKYSVTTSKHQSAVRTVLMDTGYAPTNETLELNGFTMRVWR